MGSRKMMNRAAAVLLLLVGAACIPSCNGIGLAPPADPEVAIAELVPVVVALSSTSTTAGVDTTITPTTPDDNFGSATLMSGPRVLVRFDAANLRDNELGLGAVIISARLELYADMGYGTFNLARSNVNWTEGGATWSCRDDPEPLDHMRDCPLNDWTSTPYSAVIAQDTVDTSGAGDAVASFDVTADVQAIVSSPTAGHNGWFVLPEGGAAAHFHSREGGIAPRLVIHYSTSSYAPVEPTSVPELDRSAPTHTYDAMSWLLEPDRGLQWGFTPGIFEVDRAAVIRGRVLDRNTGNPIAGVEVSVLGHPEFGRTRTRVGTGVYELMVNGGETYTFVYTSETHLGAQRQLTLPWNGWQPLPDIALMLRTDLAGGTITGATGGFVIGPTVSDSRGSNRSIRLYVPAGTRVQYVDDAGAVQTSNNFEVRLGEYTRTPAPGVDPLAAMPAELPPTTSYTYAAEGEVLVGGVRRSRPRFQTTAGADTNVFMYVRIDNFLTGSGFTAGSPVPYGSFDGARGGWSPENNGVIIGVSSATGSGCVTGASVPEAGALCNDKVNFPAGTYMRVPIQHFCFVDLNWLIGLFQELPEGQVDKGDPDGSCIQHHSIIYCDAQILGERWPISATPYSLMYLSDRHLGRAEDYRIRVRPLAAPGTIPTSVRVDLLVAGEVVDSVTQSSGLNSTTELTVRWDGLDAYNRRLIGPQRAELRLGYTYVRGYRATLPGGAGFGGIPSGTEAELGTNGEVTAWRRRPLTIGNIDDLESGLGGLGIDAHHFYDPATGTLIMGNGFRRSAESVAATVDSPIDGYTGVGAFASSTLAGGITALTVGPDGTVYYFNDADNRLYRRARGDAGATTLGTATYSLVTGLSVGRFTDATGTTANWLWVADNQAHRIYRVNLVDGTRTPVIGTGSDAMGSVSVGSPVAASGFAISFPKDVEAAPDGSLYFVDASDRIMRYRMRSIGGGAVAEQIELLVANGGARVVDGSLALAPDGTLYFSSHAALGGLIAIERLRPDGRREIAGGLRSGGTDGTELEDGAAFGGGANCAALGEVTDLAMTPTGELCFGSAAAGSVRPRVRCVRDGQVFTVAGVRWSDTSETSFGDANQVWQTTGPNGGPATRTLIGTLGRVAWSPNGALFFADGLSNGTYGARVRVATPTLDGSLTNTHVIASSDGSMYYEFNGAGRHLRTVNAITGVNVHVFTYDATPGSTLGRLEGIYDVENAFTDIQWVGNQIRIVAPGSVTTTIERSSPTGYVSRVCSALMTTGECASPPGHSDTKPYWEMTFGATGFPGLLTLLTDARGGTHTFGYTVAGGPAVASGRLISDSDVGAVTTLSPASTTSDGWRRVTVTRPADAGTGVIARDISYDTRNAGTGVLERRVSRGSGTTLSASTVASIPADGREASISHWNGSTTTITSAPDPRPTFGSDAPYAASSVSVRPSMVTTTVTRSRTYVASPFALTDTATLPTPPGASGAATWTRAVTTITGGYQVVLSPPSGDTSRQTTALLDSRGRVTQVTMPGRHPICFTYPTSTAVRPSLIRRAPLSGGTCNASSTLRREVAYDYAPSRYMNEVRLGYGGTSLQWNFVRGLTGRVSLVYRPGGASLSLGFDAHENLRTISAGALHTFTWTARDELLAYTPPNPNSLPVATEIISSSYRDSGTLSTRSYRGSRTAGTTLDPASGFVSAVTHTPPASANNLSFLTRDAGGRPTSVTSPAGNLGITYDGDVTTDEVSTPSGSLVPAAIGGVGTYHRDVAESRTLAGERSCFGASCRSVLRSYHVDGFLLQATDDADGSAGTSADRAGWMAYSIPSFSGSFGASRYDTATAGGVSVTTSVSESALGELTSSSTYYGGWTAYREQVCERDALGRVLRRAEQIRTAGTPPGSGAPPTQYRWYQYDYESHGYLSRVRVWTNGASMCPTTFTGTLASDTGTWAYDHRGNRTTGFTVNNEDQVTGIYVHNDIGQLITRGGRSFTYDLSGHLRSTWLTAGPGPTTYFDYDARGRVVSIRPGGGPTANNPAQRFIYRDQLNPVAWQRTARNLVTCPGGVDTARFIYGTDPHTPDLMVYDDCSNGVSASDVYRLLRDERGSVRLVIQVTTGVVIQRVDYGPWGEPTGVIPGSAISTYVVQPFGFAGGIWMPEAQLWHFGARDLDPSTGRWTTKDPILFAGGYNLYVYASNDPVNRVDLSGLRSDEFYQFQNEAGLPTRPSSPAFGERLAEGLLRGSPGSFEAWNRARMTRDANFNDVVVPGTASEEWRNAEHYLWAYDSTSHGHSLAFELFIVWGYSGWKLFDDDDSPPTFDELNCGISGAYRGAEDYERRHTP